MIRHGDARRRIGHDLERHMRTVELGGSDQCASWQRMYVHESAGTVALRWILTRR